MNLPVPDHVPASRVVHDYPFQFGATTTENPHKTLVPRVHEGPEIFYSTNVYPGGTPGWVPRRLEDLRALYLDTEHFSSAHFSPFAMLIGESWNLLPAEMDPPMHAAYRAVLNPLFSPKRLRALDEDVRAAARKYIARFKDKGECDFVRDFALAFPIEVFLRLVDLPLERAGEFLEWEDGLLHSETIESVIAATANVVKYLREVIEARRRKPGDDFISFGVKAEIQGRPLTDDELVGFCFNLYIGGLDTVSSNLGLHFRHLAETPAHQKRLRENPSIIPVAQEELYRAYSAVTTFRTCIKETTVRGMTIKPGDKMAMPTILGNTDPAAFERPNEVDFDRGATHATFGFGIHRCIGSHLARREAEIALEEFLAAIPPFEIKPGAEIVTGLGGVVQPRTLPLVWQA